MTVQLLNIVSKGIDQEPNPFEQSFSSVSNKLQSYGPPVKQEPYVYMMDFDENLANYQDSYSTLSDQLTASEDSGDDHSYQLSSNLTQYSSYTPNVLIQQKSMNIGEYQPKSNTRKYNNKSTTKPKRIRNTKIHQDEEKRKNFLERNRLAALKCRQRKKQWVANLQARVEFLMNDNQQMQMEREALQKQILELKASLLAHKNCSHYLNSVKTLEQQQNSMLYHYPSMLKDL